MNKIESALRKSLARFQMIDKGQAVFVRDAIDDCKSALSDIDKCAPVYLIVSGADEIVVTKEKYDSWTSAKRISYTSPISKEWVVIDEETIDDIGNTLSDEQGFIPVETWTEFARAIEAKLKQLNAPEKG